MLCLRRYSSVDSPTREEQYVNPYYDCIRPHPSQRRRMHIQGVSVFHPGMTYLSQLDHCAACHC